MNFLSGRVWMCVLSCVLAAGVACGQMPTGGDTNGEGDMDGMGNTNVAPHTVTVTFDGDGGVTPSGATAFSLGGASFSGGTVRSVGNPSLYGSGAFSYEVLDGSTVVVEFDDPVDLLEVFLATRNGGQLTFAAQDADGQEVGSAGANGAALTVDLSAPASRVEIIYTGQGDGWVDNFTFRAAS